MPFAVRQSDWGGRLVVSSREGAPSPVRGGSLMRRPRIQLAPPTLRKRQRGESHEFVSSSGPLGTQPSGAARPDRFQHCALGYYGDLCEVEIPHPRLLPRSVVDQLLRPFGPDTELTHDGEDDEHTEINCPLA